MINQLKLYIHQICYPEINALPNEHARKLQYRQNRNFFISLTTMLCISISTLMMTPTLIPVPVGLAEYWFIAVFAFILMVFCITCRSYFKFFGLFFCACMSLVGPTALYLDDKGIFACYASVHLTPLLLLFYTRSGTLYAGQVIIQLFYLNFHYKSKMREALNFIRTDDFTVSITVLTEFTVVACAFAVHNISSSLKSTYKQEIALGEKKRKELEVQKNFILSFSHEIRNLINTLTGNIQLSLLEEISPNVKNHLENAEIGASMLIQLINNILDTGNVEVGELEVTPTNQLIHLTLEKMWRMCAYLMKAKNLKGQLRILKNLPKHLKLDHSRLLQILINLTMNAVKFTDGGSVDIKLEWLPGIERVTDNSFFPYPFDDEDEGVFEKDQTIWLLRNDYKVIGLDTTRWGSDRCNDKQGFGMGLLKITITDTGCGVHPDNISKVFEKFSEQIFGDSSSNRLGTTIGLYITKVLCNQMGGDVRVFSKPNKGTSFIACIPAEQVATKKLGTIEAILPEPKKLKSLIVDDMNFNIIVLTSYLQRMNIEIINTAINGSDAYTKYVQSAQEGNKPDVVTMDVEMPVMDGKEAARMIRKYERENNLEPCFLIMISGNVGESEINQCLWHNGEPLANCFMKKPAIFDDVFRVINDHFFISSKSDLSTCYL